MEEQKNYHPYRSRLDESAEIYQKQGTKSERQKWNALTAKEKMQYFKDYYIWPLTGLLVLVVIVVFLIVHFATKQEMIMGIMAVNADGTKIEATSPEYFDSFLEEQGVNTKHNKVNLNYAMYINANLMESIDDTNLQTIQTLFMTRSVDVFFSDEEFYRCMAGTDYIADLRDYLPQELLDKYEDKIIYVDNMETGKTIAAGIHIEDNQWVAETGWYDNDTVVVGLADGMRQPELAVALLKKILGEN